MHTRVFAARLAGVKDAACGHKPRLIWVQNKLPQTGTSLESHHRSPKSDELTAQMANTGLAQGGARIKNESMPRHAYEMHLVTKCHLLYAQVQGSMNGMDPRLRILR